MAHLMITRRQKHIEVYEPARTYICYESGSQQLYKKVLKPFNDTVFICTACGRRVEDFEGKFCGYCGEKLEGFMEEAT